MTVLSTKYFVLYSIAMDARHVGVNFEEFTQFRQEHPTVSVINYP